MVLWGLLVVEVIQGECRTARTWTSGLPEDRVRTRRPKIRIGPGAFSGGNYLEEHSVLARELHNGRIASLYGKRIISSTRQIENLIDIPTSFPITIHSLPTKIVQESQRRLSDRWLAKRYLIEPH